MGAFQKGLRDGLPIGLGYFSVSIGFGLIAVGSGLTVWQALLISLCNLTSAGQLAGVRVMQSGGGTVEMAVTQAVINLRYALMATALGQKLDKTMTTPNRLFSALFITDEIYAVSASQEGRIGKGYLRGIAIWPYFGWALGTLAGAAAGTVLPAVIQHGLGLAIYGMFLAIVLPPARKDAAVRTAVLLSAGLSCAFRYLPGLSGVSGGFSVVLCAAAASAFCALRHPVEEG